MVYHTSCNENLLACHVLELLLVGVMVVELEALFQEGMLVALGEATLEHFYAQVYQPLFGEADPYT